MISQGEIGVLLKPVGSLRQPAWFIRIVVKDRQIAYRNAFGYADKPHHIKATPDTVYHWWSMTKIPTAIAMMQWREQARIDLNDPVKKYLPWFDVTYPSDKSSIIIRNLLQHTSGLPDTIPAMIGIVILANGTDLDRDGLMDLLANIDWENMED